ncbi:YcxB family protein [Bradyrhizobium diazoefficiens]|nr:YcxB family protein [Bradyrhizobium diazoefficiens]
MGEDAIEVIFHYLPGEYARAVRVHILASASTHANAIIALLTLAAGIAIVQADDPHYFWLGVIFIGLSLAIPLYYVWGLLSWRDAARGGRLLQEYRLTFSDSGIHYVTDSIDSRINWKLFRYARRVRGYYLLYCEQRQFTVVPSRVFKDADQLKQFEDLLRRHIRRVELPP